MQTGCVSESLLFDGYHWKKKKKKSCASIIQLNASFFSVRTDSEIWYPVIYVLAVSAPAQLSYGITDKLYLQYFCTSLSMRHGDLCGRHQADGMCLISLTQRNETRMRFTNLQARLMAKDTVPTHTGGIFPLFKDNEMTMYSVQHQIETGFVGRMEGETVCSTCLLSLIRREKQLSFFVSELDAQKHSYLIYHCQIHLKTIVGSVVPQVIFQVHLDTKPTRTTHSCGLILSCYTCVICYMLVAL